MNKEFKDIAEKSQKVLSEATEKAESFIKDLSGDALVFWKELEEKMTDVQSTLKDVAQKVETKTDEAVVDAKLGMMEAKQKITKVEKSLNEFVHEQKHTADQQADIAKLRAHLAKMEAEDAWEETSKKLRHELAQKKVEAEALAKDAADEVVLLSAKIKDLFS
jgi:ElaB/YqjD/DUF883 family membrane-anchored ribosome-binding protein